MNQLEPIISILTAQDRKKLNDIQEELQDSWHKRQIFRTDTEARYSVLNKFKFPTKASQYWQAVREQMVHFDELTSVSFDIRRKKIDLKEVQANIKDKEVKSQYEIDRLLVDRDELLFQIAGAARVAQDRVREIMQWSTIKKEVNDGSFDDKDVNTHQKESLFRSVLNRARVAPKDISAEERLSIDGILHMLKDEPVNKKLVDSLNKEAKAKL